MWGVVRRNRVAFVHPSTDSFDVPSRLFGLLAVGLLLPSLAGCVTGEGSLGGRCDSWTLADDPEGGIKAHVHVRSERAEAACVEVRFGGTLTAQVPLEPPATGGWVEDTGRSLEWPEHRTTVRAEETMVGPWASQAVDLEQSPHVVVNVTDGELDVYAVEQAPDWS